MTRHRRDRVRAGVVLALVGVLLAVLAACSTSEETGSRGDVDPSATTSEPGDPGEPDEGASTGGDRPGTSVRLPRLAEGDPTTAGLDFPKLPRDCFARGQQTPRAAPCPLTRIRADRPTLIIWGDSHAWQYLPAVRAAVRGRPVNLVSFVAGGCPPAKVPASYDDGPKCFTNDRAAVRFIRYLARNDLDYEVLLSSYWAGFRNAWKLLNGRGDPDEEVPELSDFVVRSIDLAHDGTPPLFAELARLRARVTVVDPSPTVPLDAAPCAAGEDPYACDVPRSAAIPHEASTRAWLQRLAEPLRGPARFVDPTTAYCDATACFGSVDGVPTFYDDLHLGADLAATMRSYFTPVVDGLLAAS